MSNNKCIRKFRNKVRVDKTLRDQFQATKNLWEVVSLAADNGFKFTYEQIKDHAEQVVEQRAETQEIHSNDDVDGLDVAGTLASSNWLFWRKKSVHVWEQEMSRLVYFDAQPSYDSDARFREKGG
jgi:predicted ribosomally synthesized peptide with nif11-like leader